MKMQRERHNGIGVGFPCSECGSDEAYVDYGKDEQGFLVALLLECVKCGHFWTERIGQ